MVTVIIIMYYVYFEYKASWASLWYLALAMIEVLCLV